MGQIFVICSLILLILPFTAVWAHEDSGENQVDDRIFMRITNDSPNPRTDVFFYYVEFSHLGHDHDWLAPSGVAGCNLGTINPGSSATCHSPWHSSKSQDGKPECNPVSDYNFQFMITYKESGINRNSPKTDAKITSVTGASGTVGGFNWESHIDQQFLDESCNVASLNTEDTSRVALDEDIKGTSLPSWLKTSIQWWAEGKTTDREFADSLEHLIKIQIIISPRISLLDDDYLLANQASELETKIEIPSWIKNNASWWAKNQISNDDFVKGIEFLIEEGIISSPKITVSEKSTQGEQSSSQTNPSILDPETAKIAYQTQKWNEVVARNLVNIKNFESSTANDSARFLWNEYAETKNQDLMYRAQLVQKTSSLFEQHEKDSLEILHNVSEGAEKAKINAKNVGLTEAEIDSLVTEQQFLIDNIKKIENLKDLENAYKDSRNASQKASEGLKNLMINYFFKQLKNDPELAVLSELELKEAISLDLGDFGYTDLIFYNLDFSTEPTVKPQSFDDFDLFGDWFESWKVYAPRIPGLLERIQQPLYDRNTVAWAGTGQLNFFQVPLGGTPAKNTNSFDTNMDQGGSIPYPKNFEIHAIRLINQYSSTADLNQVYGQTLLQVLNGRPDDKGIYVLAEPVDLIPQQNFRCEVRFPTPSTMTSSVDLSVYLDGFFKREVHSENYSENPSNGNTNTDSSKSSFYKKTPKPLPSPPISLTNYHESSDTSDLAKELGNILLCGKNFESTRKAFVDVTPTHSCNIHKSQDQELKGNGLDIVVDPWSTASHFYLSIEIGPEVYYIQIPSDYSSSSSGSLDSPSSNTSSEDQSESESNSGSETPQSSEDVSITVLVINGNYYPITQFTTWKWQGECDSQWHYHSPTGHAVDLKFNGVSDPDPDECGFGKVAEIEKKVISITQDQANAFEELTGVNPIGNVAVLGGEGP